MKGRFRTRKVLFQCAPGTQFIQKLQTCGFADSSCIQQTKIPSPISAPAPPPPRPTSGTSTGTTIGTSSGTSGTGSQSLCQTFEVI